MSKYEITQAQFKAVMGTNPSSFKGDDLPVDSVSWTEAVEFCHKLSTTTGREYRLPTEAEWNSPVAQEQKDRSWKYRQLDLVCF